MSTGQQGFRQLNREQLTRILLEMDANNVRFNYQGEPALPGQPILTRDMITFMISQLEQGLFKIILQNILMREQVF